MKRLNRTKLLQTLLLTMLLGVMCNCAVDEINDLPIVDDDAATVNMSVKIPSGFISNTENPKTYALSADDENEVDEIVVLLFDTNNNYTHEPIYVAKSNIANSGTNSSVKTFSVKVPFGNFNMVLLANANAVLNSKLSSINVGDAKSEVLQKLIVTNAGKWNVTAGTPGYMHIPMWGEATINTSSGGATSASFTLARMLAKIDVALTTGDAKSKFNLQSVSLYNYNDKGLLVPTDGNWSGTPPTITAPSVPINAAATSSNPLVYSGDVITKEGTKGISCINEIYTFEAPMGNATTFEQNTCLVVGGNYNGESQVTYYRLDFANISGAGASATTTFVPLLRNNQYKINIVDITASGAATEEDAYKASSSNIVASIISWNDAQITDIVFDGQHMLGVSQGEFTFSREERNSNSDDNGLAIVTDCPSGVNIDKIVDADNSAISWLGIVMGSSVGGSNKTYGADLLIDENDTGNTRTGYIHLSAARLKYVVKVNQMAIATGVFITNASNQPIEILEFAANINEQPAQQQFKVSWPGSMSYLSFINNSMANPFVFTPDEIPSSGKLTDAIGEKTYTIQPPAITSAELASDPFYERSSTIVYTIPDGMSVINRDITLLQYVPNIVPVVDDFYLMDGTKQSFGVRSNTPFTVTVKSNPYNVITQLTTTGAPNTSVSGTPIHFDIVNDLTNPVLLEKVAVVTISSPNGLFPDTDITLNCISGIIQPESNSYIVKPNSKTILIPVSRANKSMLGSQLGSNEFFSAELVWTDNKNRIADNSNIKNIKAVGKGSSGYLFIEPGSGQGNAVVAIKNTSGKILWSWHIWVTAETPAVLGSKGFMDRNLGAIGNTPGALKTKGLLYQGGRKDPLPGSDAITNGAESMLYTANIPTLILREEHKEYNNFQNSVAHPATFYTDGNDNWSKKDWYTNNNYGGNSSLWGGEDGSSKTVYDPCPVGWKIPTFAAWDGIDDNFVEGNSGRTNNDYGGFYPLAGNRSIDGSFSSVGEAGLYWSRNHGTGTGNASKCLKFTETFIFRPHSSIYRAGALSVRCIKDN